MHKQPNSNRQLQSMTSNGNTVLDVYLRNSRRQALLVHISPRTKIQQLNKAVATCFGIPSRYQVLVMKGKQLQDLRAIRILDKAIIHVIDTRNITALITITIKTLHTHSTQTYTVSSSQLIGDFIATSLDCSQLEKLFLVYASKRLNNNLTFAEQFVQNGSEMVCLQQLRDSLKTVKFYNHKSMPQQQAERNQSSVDQQQNQEGLSEYVPQINNSRQQEHNQAESPVSISHLKDWSTKGTIKQISVPSTESKVKRIKYSKTISNQSLMLSQKQKKMSEERELWSSRSIEEGSIISEIDAPQRNLGQKNFETVVFQRAMKALRIEALPAQQKELIIQQNLNQGELVKIVGQLQKWQESIKKVRTVSKSLESSLEAVEVSLLIEGKNTAKSDQDSCLSQLRPKQAQVVVQSTNQQQQQLLFNKKQHKIEVLNDPILQVQNSPAKNQKQISKQPDAIIDTPSQKEPFFKPQSDVMMDVSFGQEADLLRSTKIKNKKHSQKHQSVQSLQNVQIKTEAITWKCFNSQNNMFETEMKASAQQKLALKQFIFRSEPCYFEPLEFYMQMFYQELKHKAANPT